MSLVSNLRSLWHWHPGGFNAGMLVFAASGVTACVSIAMLCVGGFSYLHDQEGWVVTTGIAFVMAAVAVPIAIVSGRASPSVVVRPRDLYLAVTMSWVLASILGALPLLLESDIRSLPAAVFETMSGFTTTGSTVFDSMEELPDAVLLWRSTMQWLGGVGIILLLVAVAPAMASGAGRVLFAEMAGPTKDRYTPRIADTARALARIYIVLTLACIAAYAVAGMTLWDSLNHAFTTVSTGGFSTHTASFGYWDSAAIRMTSIIFMTLGGVNFGVAVLIVLRQQPTRLQRYELVSYVGTLIGLSVIVALSVWQAGDIDGWWTALLEAAFTVTSVVTTTGYITSDFDTWNEFARTALVFIMFVGGCAGSTVGGVKIIRWMLLGATIRAEMKRLMHPASLPGVRVGGRRFDERTLTTLLAFLAAYLLVFAAAAIGLTITGADFTTSLSASAASLNLVGPALADAGASESFSGFSDTGLVVLTLAMLMGRLEVFTVLVLLMPSFWRRR